MKLVHLVGFIIKKFVMMQNGHVNVKLHNMFLLLSTVCGHEHAKRPQYTVALHISPCPSEQAVRPGCSAELFLSPVPLQYLQTAQTAKSDCLVV